MTGQLVVKFMRNLVDGVQARPRNSRKVVVFVVQPDIVRDPVERAVVGKGLGHGDIVRGIALRGRDGFVDVVLCDEVACDGVEAACEEGGEEEVEDCVGRGVVD